MTLRHPHTCAHTLHVNGKSLFYLPYIHFLMQNPPNSHPGARPRHCPRAHCPHHPPPPLHAHTLDTHARCDESVTLTLAPTRPNLTLAPRASISPSPLLHTCECSLGM
jgi:hypothetical protein